MVLYIYSFSSPQQAAGYSNKDKVKISDIENYIGKKKITRKGKEEEKKTRIPKKKIKEFLRKKYWKNKFLGECYCCGEPLTFDHAQLGRIKSGREDGEYTVENCGLICQTCNSAMREMNMKDFMKKHFPSQYQKHFGSKDKTKTTSGTKRRKPVKRKTITSKRRKL